MISITKEYRTETGHRLMNYDGKCAHLHGHSYLWQVTATGRMTTGGRALHNGMVMDFKDLKATMVSVLEPLDHCMLLSDKDPMLDVLKDTLATNDESQRIVSIPLNPTAENMAMLFGQMINYRLYLLNVELVTVKLWETATSYAQYVFQSESGDEEPTFLPTYYNQE